LRDQTHRAAERDERARYADGSAISLRKSVIVLWSGGNGDALWTEPNKGWAAHHLHRCQARDATLKMQINSSDRNDAVSSDAN
jgi:hypothetical protein